MHLSRFHRALTWRLELMQFQLMCLLCCWFQSFRLCGSCTCDNLIHCGASRCCHRGYHVDNVFWFAFDPTIHSVRLHGHPLRRYTARPRGFPLSKCSMQMFVPSFLRVASPRGIPTHFHQRNTARSRGDHVEEVPMI